jgi:hypothetical protein
MIIPMQPKRSYQLLKMYPRMVLEICRSRTPSKTVAASLPVGVKESPSLVRRGVADSRS